MLRPGQRSRAVRGFGGGVVAGGAGRRQDAGFTAPSEGGWLQVWITTDVVGHVGQIQFLPLRHSSFPMNPNNPGFADLTSQRDFP